MTKAQYEIDRAFLLISSLPVTGEGVEVMASAREHLRAAYKLAAEKKDPDGGNEDSGGQEEAAQGG